MRIHHLNCGSLRAIPLLGEERLAGSAPGQLATVCHCLLIETDSDGLILVDTGLGIADRHDPGRTLGADWVAYAQPARYPEESALRQVVRLGYAPEDVRHIVLTHLHRDHTGGLPDFPHARVHVPPGRVRGRHRPLEPVAPAQPRPLHAGAPGARPAADGRRPGRRRRMVRLFRSGTSAGTGL
ncbi:MBL fold metallo-hydrolase [Streptomyces sp. NPDC001691]|uniref:MBL fold metallo-hydrolase n=1 Tax=Streptomyces sp. NPDC001691 TaxID=3364600 RepID=UPI00368707BB